MTDGMLIHGPNGFIGGEPADTLERVSAMLGLASTILRGHDAPNDVHLDEFNSKAVLHLVDTLGAAVDHAYCAIEGRSFDYETPNPAPDVVDASNGGPRGEQLPK